MQAETSDRVETSRSKVVPSFAASAQQEDAAAAAWKAVVSVCLISVIGAGCATAPTRSEKDFPLGAYDVIVPAIRYDETGLPAIGPSLAERPSKPGDHFTVVRFREGKPAISYDVVVVRQAPDFARPLEVVYEWTGRGFTMGVNVTKFMSQGLRGGSAGIQGGREAAIVLFVVVVAPIAAGTAGGFIVGVADGARHTALELGKVIVPGEQVVTWTAYEFDDAGRLRLMRMLSPDRAQELVRTEFEYEGAGMVPSRTTVKTQPVGKGWKVE